MGKVFPARENWCKGPRFHELKCPAGSRTWRIEEFVPGLFEEDLHAERVESLTNGVDGVLHAASAGARHRAGARLREVR